MSSPSASFVTNSFRKIGMVGENIIHACGLDDAAKGGMGPYIGYLFSKAPDLSAVIQAVKVLLNCLDHRLLLSWFKIKNFLTL